MQINAKKYENFYVIIDFSCGNYLIEYNPTDPEKWFWDGDNIFDYDDISAVDSSARFSSKEAAYQAREIVHQHYKNNANHSPNYGVHKIEAVTELVEKTTVKVKEV